MGWDRLDGRGGLGNLSEGIFSRRRLHFLFLLTAMRVFMHKMGILLYRRCKSQYNLDHLANAISTSIRDLGTSFTFGVDINKHL